VTNHDTTPSMSALYCYCVAVVYTNVYTHKKGGHSIATMSSLVVSAATVYHIAVMFFQNQLRASL